MAFANEAKDYTIDKINGKIVNVKLFKKDQYSRVIGKVVTDDCYPMDSFTSSSILSSSPSTPSSVINTVMAQPLCPPNYDHLDLSIGLAHNGYSTLYSGKGAEYDGNETMLKKEIQFAQAKRLGVWTNGIENVQSPAEYKRALKENAKMNKLQAIKDI